MSLCIGDRLVCRIGWNIQTCIPDGHLHTVTCTRSRIDTTDSPDDEHMIVRNMHRIEINISEKINVRQVGYLQGLYRDARSAKHKIQLKLLFNARLGPT